MEIPADIWPTFIESVQDSEGFSDTPYKDSRGYWTVGYGHKLGDSPGPGRYTKEMLRVWLVLDLEKAEDQAKIFLYRKSLNLSPVRFTVLVEMAFILGYVGASKFTQFFAALRAQDWTAACFELRHTARGKISPWYKEEPSRVDKLCSRLITDSFSPER